MNPHPILFSAPMVQALLDGRKTQTRRVVKHPENYGCPTGDCPHWKQTECNEAMQVNAVPECPYGKPGDLLWVRETFARNGLKDGEKVFYRADGESQFMGEMRESNGNITRYFTDHWERNGEKRTGADWKPSIHMPRWASRLTLEITGVRVERLQDIPLNDARAEGCEVRQMWLFGANNQERQEVGATVFGNLWKSINTKPGIRWEDNPWVWVLEFKVHRCNVDELMKARAA